MTVASAQTERARERSSEFEIQNDEMIFKFAQQNISVVVVFNQRENDRVISISMFQQIHKCARTRTHLRCDIRLRASSIVRGMHVVMMSFARNAK